MVSKELSEAAVEFNCILDNSSKESLTQVYNMFKDIISNNYNNEDIILRTDDDITFQLSNSLN